MMRKTSVEFLEIECEKVETTEQLREYLRECSAGAELAIALNIKGEHQLDLKLEGLALCAKPERSIYLDLSQSAAPQNEMIAEVKKMLESATNPKIFHGLEKSCAVICKYRYRVKRNRLRCNACRSPGRSAGKTL